MRGTFSYYIYEYIYIYIYIIIFFSLLKRRGSGEICTKSEHGEERERERGEESMCMEKLGGRNGSSSQENREERVYAGVKRGIVFY